MMNKPFCSLLYTISLTNFVYFGKMMYGDLPAVIGHYEIDCQEMMFYQYLPIKLQYQTRSKYEQRLGVFYSLIYRAVEDFKNKNGPWCYNHSYVYLTAKHMWQDGSCSYNRKGWHTDGFGTDDTNYIWSNSHPTIFNSSSFNLSSDDTLSMKEMEEQAIPKNDVIYPNNYLLRLNQYNVHKVNDWVKEGCMRTFVKITFSKDKYDLIGNSHNYELDYNWEMRPRAIERNIPQNA